MPFSVSSQVLSELISVDMGHRSLRQMPSDPALPYTLTGGGRDWASCIGCYYNEQYPLNS